MSDFDVDLFVIGGGSGGVRAARVAAGHGATVMLAEEFRLGGTCVIRGCVPKKLFVYAGRFRDAFDEAAEFGWHVPDPVFDWPRLVAAKDRETARLEAIYLQGQGDAGVTIVRSRAVLEDARTVRVVSDGRLVRARRILVATGARPELPAIEGVELAITSNEVFDLPSFPRRLVIVGAGYIAVELAGLFSALGSAVSIVCRGDNVLRGFDESLRECVAASYAERGVALLLGDSVNRIKRRPDGSLAVATSGGRSLAADQVVMAVGRAPNTGGLGLERAGIALDARGAVLVDAHQRSSVEGVYAVGDVTNRLNLTPVAIREGHAFADDVFGNKRLAVDRDWVPTAVFSTPEVGTVGLTEAAARLSHDAVDVYQTSFRPLATVVSGKGHLNLAKLVVDATTSRVLGVHLFADAASEMVQMAGIAVRAGATIGDFLGTMAVHPTVGEEIVTMRTPVARHRRSPAAS